MNSNRLPMIDVIRFVSFMAIIIFHTSYALWAPAGLDGIPQPSWWIIPFEFYARVLSFSGFSILFLSFFLFGYKQDATAKWFRLWLILLGFFVVWAIAGGEFPYIWDIYPFLLVVIALAVVTRNWPAHWLIWAGFLITSIPSAWISIPLFGNCALSDRLGEDWPLLPWMGYPIFALGLGKMARNYSATLCRMTKFEGALWLLLLGLTCFKLGEYFHTPLGDRYACYMYRRPPGVFWSHQAWIIFFVRLGLVSSVADGLNQNLIVQWLSRRPVNRKFFVTYFVHYPFCLAYATVAGMWHMSLEPWVFAAVIVGCVIWL